MSATKKYPFEMTPVEQAEEMQRRLAKLDELRAWRDAAVADGWTLAPTYTSESVERACRLTRDGYTVSILTRAGDERSWPIAAINAWCPRNISLDHALKPEYDGAALIAGARFCPNCGAQDVDTVRIHFAMRSCEACVPSLRAEYEVGNWTE
jgi:hypothetical protein